MTKQNQFYPQVVFHPGETLAEKLEEIGMGSKEFAVRTGKPEKTISMILNGKSGITPDMAVQFESVTKIPAHFWLNSQRNYEEYLARQKRNIIIAEAEEWTRKFPLADMIKKGWLLQCKSIAEKTAALFSFFKVSTPEAWEAFYFGQQLRTNFRISLAHIGEPYAISAWLRMGEIQSEELDAPIYSETKFKEVLPEIKSLMAEHPADFFYQMQQLCLSAGVKVVHTPCISKAPINGSTRWLGDNPFIQLSGRYKRNDIFWFTFFHEAGHIIKHGKKDIFLENVKHAEYDERKEKEADRFAVIWTLSDEEESEILENDNLSEQDIINFAKKFNTHPAIIIGRLQHKKLLPYTVGKSFFEKVELSE